MVRREEGEGWLGEDMRSHRYKEREEENFRKKEN